MGLVDKDYLSEIKKDASTVAVRDLVRDILKDMEFPKSDIRLLSCFIDKYDKNVVEFSGGLNGCGNWTDYFEDLSRIINNFEKHDIHLWLIQLDNDCLDDVFYAYFGCRIV